MSQSNDILSDLEEDNQPKGKKVLDEGLLSFNRKEVVKAALKNNSIIYHNYKKTKESWGKNKKQYYKDQQSSAEDSEAQDEEEIEADFHQQKTLKKMNDDDYWDNLQNNEEEVPMQEEQKNTSFLSKLLKIKDPQALSKKQLKQQILHYWPEINDVLAEIDKLQQKIKINENKLKEVRKKYSRQQISLQIKSDSCYLILMLFYLQLKCKNQISEQHPLYQRILEAKEISKSIRQIRNVVNRKERKNQEKQLKLQENIKQTTLSSNLKKNKKQKKIQKAVPLEELINNLEEEDQIILNPNKKQKKVVKEDHLFDMEDSYESNQDFLESDKQQDDFYKENVNQQQEKKTKQKTAKKELKEQQFNELDTLLVPKTVAADEPRKINYVMLKRKSLMQRRRGNRIKNSRVKHKLKYEKAVQKLKTQGKFHKIQQNNFYSGEKGVKATQIRSVKIS